MTHVAPPDTADLQFGHWDDFFRVQSVVDAGTGRGLCPPGAPMKHGRAAAVCLLLGLHGPPASGQQAETQFFRLPQEVGSPRYLGLAGAFVGLGDDVNALVSNPAALNRIPRTLDAAAAAGGEWTSFLAGVSQPRPGLSVGTVLWGQPPRSELFRGATLRQAAVGRARVHGFGIGGGLRVPYEPLSWISVGASVGPAWLTMRPSDQLRGTDLELLWRVGLFFDPESATAPRVGVSFRPRSTFKLSDGAGTVRIKTPGLVSAGASWAYDFLERSRLVTSYQQDYVLYSDLTPPSGLATPRDDWDFRLGFELWIPVGRCVAGCGGLVQLRAAVVNRAPFPYAVTGDTTDATGQGPGRSTDIACGASVALPTSWAGYGKFRLDLGYDGRSETWSAGLAFRFPEAFRADLRKRRRPR